MRQFFVAAVLFTALPAAADPAPKKPADAHQMHGDDCARARQQHKLCVIDMGKGDSIESSAPTAGGSAVGVRGFPPATSLIRIRRDFIVEILKTADDL